LERFFGHLSEGGVHVDGVQHPVRSESSRDADARKTGQSADFDSLPTNTKLTNHIIKYIFKNYLIPFQAVSRGERKAILENQLLTGLHAAILENQRIEK